MLASDCHMMCPCCPPWGLSAGSECGSPEFLPSSRSLLSLIAQLTLIAFSVPETEPPAQIGLQLPA